LIEVIGDLWTHPADARCVTTNGFVKSNGAAVMGRGCAKQAMEMFPGIEFSLGQAIETHGNHVNWIWVASDTPPILSFPVKHHWRERASLELIHQSAVELVVEADKQGFRTVVLPKPGCGNGNLLWHDVRAVIYDILDDRFQVIDRR
jgi:hypothetical protein